MEILALGTFFSVAKKSLRIFAVVTFAMGSLSQSSCGNNLFSSLEPVGDDDALLYDAKQYMSNRQWTEAIAALTSMSTSAQATRSNQMELAKAYAGRCGLDLLGLANTFTSSTDNIFVSLQKTFVGATTASFDDCVTAEGIVQAISLVPTERSESENLTFAFIQLAKIGSILAARGDVDANQVPDWGNDDSCTIGDGSNDFLTSTEAKHIATGFGQSVRALEQTGGTVGGSLTTTLSAICTTLDSTYGVDMCDDTSTTGIDADEANLIRSIIQEGIDAIGLNTCTDATADIANCICLTET